ncbi:HoxN/HupN/NixA family nickel/cobalt transporter [Promicromonospora panici]|uniref:HoxN/HupN/NixA family nickel/cobalt transporter n=1 Tax=Promicromonospora panici TaxID=2219658 RepID=UPI0013ECF861|nr:high-affinity nickel-transport protein [Promicromonospora panici]
MTASTPADQHPGRPLRRERRSVTIPVIVALHVAGIGGLAAALLADGGTGAITLAMGLAAYALGLRHAFDADHIATIDNTTRTLVRADRDARGVGLWFSLGHSTVVLGAALLLALGVNALAPMLGDESSPLRRATGVWGPLVSGTFLLAIAAVNVVMLRHALRGHSHQHTGGPVTWALRRFEWSTDKPGRMYVVGLVFGLGFDTATEIGLLAITASAALGQVPWYSALPLAVLFAAGMSLLDSAQGAVARRVYTHASSGEASSGQAGAGVARPARARVRYDVVVTGVSALAALGIGLVTLVQVAVEHAPWLGWLPGASVSLEPYGAVLTVVLLVAWGIGAYLTSPRRNGSSTA